MAEDTTVKLPAHLRDDLKWQPGQSGNPAGRPRGARSKLGEAFVQDLLASWEKYGPVALDAMLIFKPHEYVKVVASVIPKEIVHTVEEYDELSDDELAERFFAVAARLAGSAKDGRRIGAALDGEGCSAPLPN